MKNLFNLFAVAIFAGMFFTACGDKTAETGTTPAGDSIPAAPAQPEASPADAMKTAWFSPNQVQDMMYDDEEKNMEAMVTVKGVIGKIWNYADSKEPVISFADSEDAESFIVDCVFKTAEDVAGLKVGSEVTISGTIYEFLIGTVALKDCVVK